MSNRTSIQIIANPSVITANPDSGTELSTLTDETNKTPETLQTQQQTTEQQPDDHQENVHTLVQNLPLMSAFSFTPGKIKHYVKETILQYIIPHVKFTNENTLDPKGSIAKLMH